MLSTSLRTATVFCLFGGVLGFVLAAETDRKDPPKQGSHMSIRAKSVIGAKVQLQGKTNVGTIEDIVFDDEGVIDYFIVSEGGKLVTVPWEAAKFNFEQRTAVINITQEQFQKIPTYTTERYPEFYTPAYQTEIYGFYNLKPGQVRRLERRMSHK